MAICEKCIKQSVCKLCDGTEIMGCIEFVGKGNNVLTTDQNEVKLLVEIPNSLYEAAFEGWYTRFDSLNCIKAIRDGQILPDGCEILTKEAYADLCVRASKGNCSEIPTGSEKLSSELEKNSKKLEKATTKNNLGVDVPDNNVGNIDCISRSEAIKVIQKYGVGCLDADDFSPEQCERYVISKLNALPSVTPQEPILDKIRAEIDTMPCAITSMKEIYVNRDKVISIIDKYKTESEE